MDYQNASLSPKERAKDLLKRMTVMEKVGQLNQRLYGFRIYERQGEEFTLTEEFRREVERYSGLGVLYGLYRADPWANKDEKTGIIPALAAKAYNTVQRYVIEHSRLGIPMLLSTECPHGHQALGGGLLPVNLAVGATFHPELLKSGYEACGRQLASGHVDLALMSVLDVLRDPRWGRSEECYSEDPYLSARMAAAAVTGMQQSGVSSVAKHFCAQGETTGGMNASPARIGERELREIHFPPMEACCKVGVDGVMAAYNEIDGVFCHANRWLLHQVLREEMGFEGVVMADGVAIDLMRTSEGDPLHAGATALHAGVDISLWDEGFSRLAEALEQGLIDEEELDEAVLRVLELKFRRGLFEHPFMEEEMLTSREAGVDEVSCQLAAESAVLLKNQQQLLPLGNRVKKIAVIGWHATDRYSQMGDYTPPVAEGHFSTILDGMREQAPEGVEVHYAMGSGFRERSEEQLAEAVRLARECDAAVVTIGGSSSRFGGASFDTNGAAIVGGGASAMDCGEGVDLATLRIPAAQEELLAAVAAVGKPVITVLVAGRPYLLDCIEPHSDALLYAFYPGPWGGRAIAQLLYGSKAPSGRLPVSFPRSTGQLPIYYNAKDSGPLWKYSDEAEGPAYGFGAGMTYTTFTFSEVRLRATEEKCDVSFHVRNTGEREGCVVPQLYVKRMEGPGVPRVRELKGFAKVELEAQEEQEIVMELTLEQISPVLLRGETRRPVQRYQISLWDNGTQMWEGYWEVKNNNK